MSKGSSPRPFSVSAEDFSNRWEAIFSKGKSNVHNVQEASDTDGTHQVTVVQERGSDSSGNSPLPADNKPSQ
jgi:hypothetical protein